MMDEYSHSHKLVDRFRRMIGPDICSQIGEEHFEELALMIESAIDASLVDVLERSAEKVTLVAKEIRDMAEKAV